MPGPYSSLLKFITSTCKELEEIFVKRFFEVCLEVPIKDNFYMSLFLRGTSSNVSSIPDYLLPPYLTKNGFQKLKVNNLCT